MTERRIFILGAGASKSHTNNRFPGIGELFLRARELNITQRHGSESRVNDEYRSLEAYIVEHFGVSIAKSTKQINVEEILSYIEIELQRARTAGLIAIDEQLK